MKDDKKSVEEILPKEEKKNLEKFADHSKYPMQDLEDKKVTLVKNDHSKKSKS